MNKFGIMYKYALLKYKYKYRDIVVVEVLQRLKDDIQKSGAYSGIKK
jgi:hypothetical protein